MNISGKRRDWVICAYLGSLICGLGGVATRVDAQNIPAPVDSRAVSIAASTTQGADWVADEELRKRVKAALHADPYFYDRHVTVSIKSGRVVLNGFVFSDWDLRSGARVSPKRLPVTDR